MKPAILFLAPFLLYSSLVFGQDAEPVAPEPEPAAAKPKADPKEEAKQHVAIMQTLQTGDVEKFLELTVDTDNDTFAGFRADILQRRGQQKFFKADIKGSLSDFNEAIKLDPKSDPYNWQRGITLYYADQFQEGKEQFERHQTVNSQDVENAVWHFLCAVRAPGGSVDSARANLIPITKDTRVPMKEVHALFAGTGTAEEVLAAAAQKGDPATSEQAKNAFLYAHLYLGIYYEALGKNDLMKEHISKAAGEYKMDHYMGMVAQVHAKLRGL